MIKSKTQRIVVTGIGIVSAIGCDVDTFFANACRGKVAIDKIDGFDVSCMNSDRGGEIRDFDITDFFPEQPNLLTAGRAKQMALAATKQCLEDARFPDGEERSRLGVAVGYTQGESKVLERATDRIESNGHLSSEDILEFTDYAAYTIPQSIAYEFQASGPNLTIGNACSAGNFAIGQAIDILMSGEANAMIAGGVDAFSRYGYAGFSRLGAIASDVPRPFSAERKGMVPGEGAAMLLLETLEHAQARNAKIYAEIAGYGESCDAFHITQPDSNGIVRAIEQALDNANCRPSEVDYISTHGTGTQASDKAEAKAFRELFGDDIPPLSSVKSMVGHAMGAASAIECVAVLLSMRDQYLTPTMNYLGADVDCPVDCVPNQGRSADINTVVKTASAFGGNNSAVIFRQLVA